MHPSAKTVIGLYERHATAFDRARGRSLVEGGWLDRFAALVAPGGAVLDLGCGSGEPIARYLLSAGYRVTGVDSAPSLIALCRARFPDQDWRVADMRDIQLGAQFSGIVAWDSFFHLPHADQRAMFARFEMHAAPGAALLFTSGPSLSEAIGSFEGEALYHASLAPDEYVRLLAAHGFRVIDHKAEDPACGGHTVWLAQADALATPENK
jgi:cyclopropane fatty-acyl-phospholipid synthase-like methyltransferase